MTSGMTSVNQKTKVVYFGNERLVSGLKQADPIVLKGLIERGYDVVAVVSHHTESRSRNARPLEVATVAEAHNIPVYLPKKPSEIIDTLRELQADIAVLVAYGRIISQEVIDIFPLGIVNLHPSLLPSYRGPAPIESPIANGDAQTGVSVMKLTAGMDDGPVYAQQPIELSGSETKYDLYTQAHKLGSALLLDSLPSIIDGSLAPSEQDHDKATYSKLFTKDDSILDPAQLTATEAERRIRAYLDFPKSKLDIYNHTVIVRKAHVAPESTPDELIIPFANSTYLAIDELIAPNGKLMDGKAFMRGYKKS